MLMNRRRALAAPALLGLSALGAAAQAQGAWPQRPVRVIIPWPPGQATDLAARISAQRLTETLGQPFVAENRAGAGGMIGTDLVAKAAPDGQTLLAASTGPIVTAPLVQRTPYDVQRDLTEICITGISPYLLVVPPNFPARTAEEFVALVRANPGRYSFSSSGTGATAHIVAAWFFALAGLDVVHVPFAGSGPALTAVVGGHVDFSIETLAGTAALIRNGQVRALGISFKNGSTLIPEVPPLARLPGLADYDAGAWIGLMAPAGTPRAILERVDGEIAKAMQAGEMRERLANAGLEPEYRGIDAMRAYIAAQRQGFATAIRAANIRIEG
jgi:tripartite-type tricarboxylate transporter receptor subunit TctC